MIINKTYDKSLWFMLCSDRVNRGRIVDFINKIPKELYDKLRISLGFYVDKEMNLSITKKDELYKSFLNGEVITSGDMRYWYMFDTKTGALNFGESIINDENEYNTFYLTIYPINDNVLNDKKEYNDCLVGEITNCYFDECSSDTVSFHLIRFSFCDIMVSSCKDYPYNKNSYRLIDIDNMPSTLTLNNLSDNCSVKKLIRGK